MKKVLEEMVEESKKEIKAMNKEVADELVDLSEKLRQIAEGIYNEVYVISEDLVEHEARWANKKIQTVLRLKDKQQGIYDCLFRSTVNKKP
jgi:hypothetical protein